MTFPRLALAGLAVAALPPLAAQSFVGFETLPTPPAVDARSSFADANGGGLVHAGMVWDARLNVIGAAHRTGGDPGNPLTGLPRDGVYFVTNDSFPDPGDAIAIAPVSPGGPVLVGAWFGQAEYYGFGHGEMTITLQALNGATVLASASTTLSANTDSDPLPMQYLDASAFAAFGDITGYRILQDPLLAGSRQWSADRFAFAAIPEPEVHVLAAGSALAAFGLLRRMVPAMAPATADNKPHGA